MAGLWRNSAKTKEGKYLVLRRDGSIPQWPYFVIGAADPAAPVCIRAYASEAERLGWDPQYVADLRKMADDFEEYILVHGPGNPDGPRHRVDDPKIIAMMQQGKGA